jgi:CPA2 family monovalent cation:H+ antiporter-2
MGLDFSLRAFLTHWRSVVVVGTIDLVINFPLCLLMGYLLGWTLIETLFLAGIMYMSSSAVVAKSLIELKRVANPETETILAIMVYEDLVIALYMAVLSGMAVSGRAEGWPAALAVMKGIGFCGAFILGARLGRRWIERLLSQDSSELFLLLVSALIMLSSFGAVALGLSEAIGAFMFGLLVSETDQKSRVYDTFIPFQQFFAALFFVSFGMLIEYREFLYVAPVAVLLFVLALAGKILAGVLAGWVKGFPKLARWNIGFALTPKGEFSIVLAGIAVTAVRPEIHIGALTALWVLLSSIAGPTLMKESARLVECSERLRPWVAQRLGKVPEA